MPKQEILYPHDECPRCGSEIYLITACPQNKEEFGEDDKPNGLPPYAYSGDTWRCSEGHTGVIYCDEQTPIIFE